MSFWDLARLDDYEEILRRLSHRGFHVRRGDESTSRTPRSFEMDDSRSRYLALYALCLGDLMIVLDTNIVNVALPSIQADLSFSAEALAWVVNAYMLTFGGFLLLSGRLGDLYGNRRVLLGGVLTGLLTWHWIFLVNVPIGIAVWLLVTRLVADERPDETGGSLDVTGAALVTVALMLAVYGVVGGNEAGWTSTRTLGILAAAVVLLGAFCVRESRVDNPLVPLRLFTLRNVSISQVVGVLWAGAMFACFFLSAL